MKIKIEKNNITGKIKPMHCTNNIPSFTNKKMLEMFADAVPYARFHDTFITVYHNFVDVSCIFPNFDADENDAKSYDFAFTDVLMQKMQEMGVKPFYRLGESIENFQYIKPYNINPPKDFEKWARVCEHIIMHYNEGWANGMQMGIEYWEIWNEPENFPDIEDNQMWRGTFDEYMELYKITASHLKNRFPNLKIGGYASCGFYEILEDSFTETAKISSRTGYFIECFHKFLQYISSEENKAPLDFFSWHSYSGVEQNIKFSNYARKTLDKYGFTKTENILNEWNPAPAHRGSVRDASNVVSIMLTQQDTSLDMLMYYDARATSTYGGMFSLMGDAPEAHLGKALPTYYVFKAFNELYKLGSQIQTSVDGTDLYAVSATNGKVFASIITNNSEKETEIEFDGIEKITKILSISNCKNLEKVNASALKYKLEAYETILIYFN